jgi:hypothetical protein
LIDNIAERLAREAKGRKDNMKLLGNAFIGVGVLCCLTIIFLHIGLAFVAVGALLRIAAGRSRG